eukprot:gene22644-29498_t
MSADRTKAASNAGSADNGDVKPEDATFAYEAWSQHYRPELVKQYPDELPPAISAKLRLQWEGMDHQQRIPWLAEVKRLQHQRRGRADRKAATSPTPPTPPRNGNAIGTGSPITSPSPLNPSATAAATADAAAAAAETTPQPKPKPKPSQSPAGAANNTAHHLDLP